MSWLDALLGRILSKSVPLELAGGLNFRNGLTATRDTAANVINVDATGSGVDIPDEIEQGWVLTVEYAGSTAYGSPKVVGFTDPEEFVGPAGPTGPPGDDATVPDATTTVNGKLRLAGDLGGTADSPDVLKINGASVPVGGALTPGHVLQVNTGGALKYDALALTSLSDAGGAGLVPVSGATPATHAWGDHGALAGRGDDDHTIYYLANCTRPFAGNPVPDADSTRTNGTTAARWATTFSDAYVGDTVALGATPALTGDVRTPTLFAIKRRSADNDADISVISCEANGVQVIGSFTTSASESSGNTNIRAKSSVYLQVGSLSTGVQVSTTYVRPIAADAMTLGHTALRFSQALLSRTFVAAGTTGAVTANTVEGSVNFAAGASTLVVTNSTVSATSLVFVQVATVDATAKTAVVVAAAGSFTITLNAAATAETRVHFKVCN